jgi:hypothetical protein
MRATLDVCVFFASTTAKKHSRCRFLTRRPPIRRRSEILDGALSVISERGAFYRIIRYITVSRRRINKAVAVLFNVHWLEK